MRDGGASPIAGDFVVLLQGDPHIHAAEWGNPGAYQRGDAPEAPLAAGALPARFRQEVAKLTLPVRFSETTALHLADFLEDSDCQTWGETSLRGEPAASRPEGAAPFGPRMLLGLVGLVLWAR